MWTPFFLGVLPLVAATRMKRAPLYIPEADAIEGKYIVMMKSDAQTVSISSTISSITADADHVFSKIGGFAASLTKEEVEALRGDPNVAYIEQNREAQIYETQENAPWGLARLSNIEPGATTYTYDAAGGEGVCAYIPDSGIDLEHPEFGGRATFVKTFVEDIEIDDNGHGTHVAGIIGSTTYGVAKKAGLFAIKIFDHWGSGNAALLIAGMEAVLEDAPTRDCPNGVAVNMSWGLPYSQAINDAAAALVAAGYFAVAAGGNSGTPSSGFSPCSEPTVCTVGSSNWTDVMSNTASYGEALDIFAPGVNILSTVPGGGAENKSGSSMAAPHVVGLGSYFMSLGEPAGGLCEYLRSIALEGVLSGIPANTTNLLAQNGLAA